MFDDDFIENLPDDNWETLKLIKQRFKRVDNKTLNREENFQVYLAAHAFLRSYLQKIGFKGKIQEPSSKNSNFANIKMMRELFDSLDGKIFRDYELKSNESFYIDAQEKFAAKLGAGFSYEFSEGDLTKIQKSINELRDLISGSELIEKDHKQRLLKRLERLQSELHKKMSDLDRFYGLMGDVGVMIRKLGEDAKPIADRIKDIMNIVWRTQARSEELESGAPNPFLKQNNESDE